MSTVEILVGVLGEGWEEIDEDKNNFYASYK